MRASDRFLQPLQIVGSQGRAYNHRGGEPRPRCFPGQCMRKRLLSTRLFTVEHREYARTPGEPITRDVVVHPGAVVILPILDSDRIVLIRNFRYAIEEELWELPAGTREPDEAAIETAGRELVEETGYRAESLTPLAAFYTSPGFCTERMHAFVATGLTRVGQALEDGEQIEVELVKRAAVHRMLATGELRDAKTIAVLGMYFARERI